MVSINPSYTHAASRGFTCVRRLPGPQLRLDPQAGVELCYVHTGCLSFRFGGETVPVRAGQLAVFWAAIPHQILPGGGGLDDCSVAAIPLSQFLSGRFPPALVQSLLHGRMLCTPPGQCRSLDQRLFSSWEADLAGDDPEIGLAMQLEMKARLHRLAWAVPGDLTAGPAAGAPLFPAASCPPAEQIAGLIARRCTGRISLGLIARELRLPAVRVAQLFHHTFGMSLLTFLTRHRVFHAQRLLVTSDAKVADVASGSGFGSLSRFNDAFRQSCGCSPREFRRRHRAIPGPA